MSLTLLTPEGLRSDGRRPLELRRFVVSYGAASFSSSSQFSSLCDFDAFSSTEIPDGISHVQLGNTKILARVYGPRDSQSLHHSSSLIRCEVSLHKALAVGRDRRAVEFATFLTDIFSSSILSDSFPESELCISIEVLQGDSGILPAAVNAASAALLNAGIPMKDFVTCSSSILVDSRHFLDPAQSERLTDSTQLTLAIEVGSGKVVGLFIEGKLNQKELEKLIETAKRGCMEIAEIMKQEIKRTSEEALRTRGTINY
jgi:exosome complex component RRP41